MTNIRSHQISGISSRDIDDWEDEGGSTPALLDVPAVSLSGSEAQVEWAERIRRQVNAEFDRVAASFRAIAAKQDGLKRIDTQAVIAILEDKRAEVMRRDQAGYFIHDWQEINDQVRLMIARDARYQAIKSNRAARRQMSGSARKTPISR